MSGKSYCPQCGYTTGEMLVSCPRCRQLLVHDHCKRCGRCRPADGERREPGKAGKT